MFLSCSSIISKGRQGLFAAALLTTSGCATTSLAPLGEADPRASVETPAELFGPLFEAVQMRRIFADGKTFADAVPRRDPAAILADYRASAFANDAALRAFVLANFDMPGAPPTLASDTARPPIAVHIRGLWPALTRQPSAPPPGGSLLALPSLYVVPGGRFREPYYWDSYFTMLGLEADGRDDLAHGLIDDFVSLIERYGHVPNGARTYYVSRSQPPFLYAMMALTKPRDAAEADRWLAALKAEHAFFTAPERTVTMPDGSELQHYWDARATPREESWREDVETARTSGRPPREVYRDLRAAAESGWDFSSRWLGDGRTLATIATTRIVPVDLNALLWGMERAIAERCRASGDTLCAGGYAARAERRRAAIERWLWSDAEGRYGDRDVRGAALRPGVTAAAAMPLFVGLSAPEHAAAMATTIERDLLAPNGLRTTTVATGQQWDRPNGWAPLQWIAIDGLERYGRHDLALKIAARFYATVEREYRASGKLLEKYDVEESRPGGGGEYPTQDGFGWTNGVTRAIQERYGLR